MLTCCSPQRAWYTTFRINVDSPFHVTKAALGYMLPGARIINSTLVDAYIDVLTRLDYAASKGAIVAFTRALSNQPVKRGIRVNAVAGGPTWTPLLATCEAGEDAAKGRHGFGSHMPMDPLGQPSKMATGYVFLASRDGAFMSGQTRHPNGGIVVNG